MKSFKLAMAIVVAAGFFGCAGFEQKEVRAWYGDGLEDFFIMPGVAMRLPANNFVVKKTHEVNGKKYVSSVVSWDIDILGGIKFFSNLEYLKLKKEFFYKIIGGQKERKPDLVYYSFSAPLPSEVNVPQGVKLEYERVTVQFRKNGPIKKTGVLFITVTYKEENWLFVAYQQKVGLPLKTFEDTVFNFITF